MGALMAKDKTHRYQTQVLWTGNLGQGTVNYRAYERSHEIFVEGKPLIPGSSDPDFLGFIDIGLPHALVSSSLR
jgi:hypothetical protein